MLAKGGIMDVPIIIKGGTAVACLTVLVFSLLVILTPSPLCSTVIQEYALAIWLKGSHSIIVEVSTVNKEALRKNGYFGGLF